MPLHPFHPSQVLRKHTPFGAAWTQFNSAVVDHFTRVFINSMIPRLSNVAKRGQHPSLSPFHPELVQRLEQLFYMQRVGGSSPSFRTISLIHEINISVDSMSLLDNVKVANPDC